MTNRGHRASLRQVPQSSLRQSGLSRGLFASASLDCGYSGKVQNTSDPSALMSSSHTTISVPLPQSSLKFQSCACFSQLFYLRKRRLLSLKPRCDSICPRSVLFQVRFPGNAYAWLKAYRVPSRSAYFRPRTSSAIQNLLNGSPCRKESFSQCPLRGGHGLRQ